MLLEDLRMSVPATVWVPLVTAGIGLLTGIGTAIGTTFLTQGRTDRREDVRWQRERDDRQEQWQREREAREEQWQHEDALRWLQNRQQTYAGLIAILYEWDNVLSSAIAVRHNDVRFSEWTPLDRDEHRAAAKAAAEVLPLVQFMAPETVRSLALLAIRDRESFWIVHLAHHDAPDLAKMDARRKVILQRRASLLEAMRGDLGIVSPADDPGLELPSEDNQG